MAKPDLLKWVSGDEAARITDPGSSKKLAGFLYREKPPFQYLNWFFNQIYKWFLGLSGNYYDVVIGSATQVTNKEATNVINEINDTLVPTGTKVLILAGLHTLTGNIVLAGNNIELFCEDNGVSIDLDSTYKIVFDGTDIRGHLKFINVSATSLEINGASSIVRVYNLSVDRIIVAANSAVLGTHGIFSDKGIFRETLSVLGSAVINLATAQSFTAQKNFLAVALTWGANVSWNLNTRQVAELTLTGATAELDNPTNMIDGGTYSIKVIQDGTGSRALTFGTAYKWPNGVVPDLSSLGINEYMRINFESDGSVMDGVAIGPFS